MVKLKAHKQNGFTLLEILIVLGVWSLLILLSAPLHISSIEKHQEKQFLKTFESDVMYVQNFSVGAPDRSIVLQFREDGYSVLNRVSDEIIRRKTPAGSIIDFRTNKELTFNKHGSISKPGTISFKTKNTKYNIIFPLGKARYYIEQQ